MRSLACLIALVGSLAMAQGPAAKTAPVPIDPLNWEAGIGSFKIVDGNGKATFSFNGTALISGLKGTMKVEGNVKKEFDEPKLKRVAYFGKGTITVEGSWDGIQVFGRELKGRWAGYGFFRPQGEFDKQLRTGFYWFDSDKEKFVWYTQSMTLQIPRNPDIINKPKQRTGG